MKRNKRQEVSHIGDRIETASRYITKTTTLLDVGCGTGLLYFLIKNKVKYVYGIDNSVKDLKIAQRRGVKSEYCDINKNKFPFIDNFFDVVTCLDVVEHIENPELLLGEIRRVCKKNGLLIIATPNIRFTDHLFELIFKGKFPKTSIDKNIYDGGHRHFFTFSDIENILIQNKFKIITKDGIINKRKRGWKGQIAELFLGKTFMREFRSQGILVVAQKI